MPESYLTLAAGDASEALPDPAVAATAVVSLALHTWVAAATTTAAV